MTYVEVTKKVSKELSISWELAEHITAPAMPPLSMMLSLHHGQDKEVYKGRLYQLYALTGPYTEGIYVFILPSTAKNIIPGVCF